MNREPTVGGFTSPSRLAHWAFSGLTPICPAYIYLGMIFASVCQARAEEPAQAHPPRQPLSVYSHTLHHRDAALAAEIILYHRLSSRGTVEVQPATNTLVVRDIAPILDRIKSALHGFDRPPVSIRLELRVVKAGPPSVISPASSATDPSLPEDILDKLQSRLSYATYRVLGEAAVTSLERQTVDYSLGPDYSVSFKLGSLLAQRRLQMEDFRIVERSSSDKGRGLEPKELFRADLNLWLNRPFTLVLSRDDERKEALLIAVTGRIEQPAGGSSDQDSAEPPIP